MDRDLVGDSRERGGNALEALDEERDVPEMRAMRPPGSANKAVGTRVDGDGESRRIAPGTM